MCRWVSARYLHPILMSSDFAGWLDDIGLPQYKDQFHESRVDGRMLQYLTVVRIFPVNISVVSVSVQLSCTKYAVLF